MFTKKHTPTYEAVASEMKALSGRHARLERGTVCASRSVAMGSVQCGTRSAAVVQTICGSGAYEAFDARNEAYALQDSRVTYRRASAEARYSDHRDCSQAAPACVDNASTCSDMVSTAELERKFQEFFRMGAVVAIGELYDEGMLGNKEAVAEEVRDYLDSFGVTGLDDIRALGISGPYLEDFERMYAMPASFPPAA